MNSGKTFWWLGAGLALGVFLVLWLEHSRRDESDPQELSDRIHDRLSDLESRTPQLPQLSRN